MFILGVLWVFLGFFSFLEFSIFLVVVEGVRVSFIWSFLCGILIVRRVLCWVLVLGWVFEVG